jgi:hypothetical protein
MWWVWVLLGLVVLLATAFVFTRGKPGPNQSELREHRRSHSGGGDPGAGAGGLLN